jgi:tetratricopeptide (TPR) repeat protein
VAQFIEERLYKMKLNTAKKGFAFWIFFLTMAFTVWGQAETEKEKIRQLEIQRQADRQRAQSMKLDSAVILMNQGNYQAADEMFLTILKSVKSVPSDITFYFGKNSYFLGKYKQSVDWLNKYIQLKGTAGQFSQESIALKQKAEVELLKEKEQEAKQALQVFSQDYDIDCGPTGKVTCPVCNGTTVIIKKSYISNTYKTCTYCNLKGVLSCEDYNKLLKGELKPSSN